jgi:hypothetical protein
MGMGPDWPKRSFWLAVISMVVALIAAFCFWAFDSPDWVLKIYKFII